ncbi:MAG: hypothetical protein ACW97Z_14705, partial [Candidatus Hodarchaeales archaeon]
KQVKTSWILILVLLTILLQVVTGSTWIFYLLVGILVYYLFTLDVDIRGSVFERELTSISFETFKRQLTSFLMHNVPVGDSIEYSTLFKELKRTEIFPEYLLLRALQDLEFRGLIKSHFDLNKQREIIRI